MTMNTQEFIKTVNALRLENKGCWYQWCGNMEVSVKEFKEFLSVCVN